MFSWLHFRYIFPLSRTLKCFARWEFTGKPDPGVDEITNGLKRLVTGVLTHPMTIGKVISAHTPKRKKDKPKSIHLIGTDTPEVSLSAFVFNASWIIDKSNAACFPPLAAIVC